MPIAKSSPPASPAVAVRVLLVVVTIETATIASILAGILSTAAGTPPALAAGAAIATFFLAVAALTSLLAFAVHS